MANSSKPDLESGIPVSQIPDGGAIKGRVGDEDVVIVRKGEQVFAVGANCTHYGGELVDGLVQGDEIRCPLHHACFSLHSGEALHAPAFDPIPCWRVERAGDRVLVREKISQPAVTRRPETTASKKPPASVVIVGGGAAALAAAEMLRRRDYRGPVTMISSDDVAPYDRPNLSKEFLSGTAPEEWMPLRSPDFYTRQGIDLLLNSRVESLDAQNKQVSVAGGKTYKFDALLLATGADPVKLPIPGAPESKLRYLRTFADARALIAKAVSAKQIVIVGASFIAMETAAALRERGVSVHVVAPGSVPLERVFGREMGGFFQHLHESHGVIFHLGQTVANFDGRQATLSGGSTVDADFLLIGVGVRPSLALAEKAGLNIDRGVLVNEYLETSVAGIFAAGDIARWPDPHSGQLLRIEHWVVAERQGQVAARNILGYRERFDAVPFFWTSQFGVSVRYVGHAEEWDQVSIEGNLEAKDCAVSYKLAGRTLAMATIGRDLANLQTEVSIQAPV